MAALICLASRSQATLYRTDLYSPIIPDLLLLCPKARLCICSELNCAVVIYLSKTVRMRGMCLPAWVPNETA